MRGFFLGLVLLISVANPLAANDRVWLGKARIFTNDKLGDGQDRWRSGSYALSWIRGTSWNGVLPNGVGDLVEYRVRSEIIAPSNLLNPVIGTDRRYVGALSFGAISHSKLGQADLALGAELVFTGPMTGIGGFQSFIHRALGLGTPQVLGSQIGNAVYPTVSLELGRDFVLSGTNSGTRVAFRPFVEAQAGVETYLRLGGDLTIGQLGNGDMMVRSTVSGFRNVALKGLSERSSSFILGGDWAYVQSSQYLPASSGFTITEPRVRIRAGIYTEGEKSSYFYGLTWLGKEFTNQTGSQVIGSFSYRKDF
jgi:hypothetical protein